MPEKKEIRTSEEVEDTDVLLVDFMNVVWRVAMANRPDLKHEEKDTSIVYLVIKMILEAKKMTGADNVLICEEGGRSTRREFYPQYKAPRRTHETVEEAAADKEFREFVYDQVFEIKEVLWHTDWAFTRARGYEADDVICTLAKRFSEKGFNVSILSNDRDMYQALEYRNKFGTKGFVAMIKRGLRGRNIFYDATSLWTDLALRSYQIPLWKALAGDKSDNYPGVYAVGPKTAADWIYRFGGVSEIKDAIEEGVLKGKRAESFMENLSNGSLAIMLALANCMDCEPEIQSGVPHKGDLRDHFNRLSFKSFIFEMDNFIQE